MAKTGTMLVKNLRYLCLVGVIALGLIAIVGSNGGGGGGGGDGETDTTQSCQNYTAIVSSPSLWTQLSPTGTAPTARQAHVSVYDAANDSLILFGGRNSSQYFNDTWVLTNASGASGTPSWNQLTTSTIPVPSQRRLAIGAYNTEKNMLIIFGGTDQNNAILMDLWVLSNANGLEGGTPTWSQLSISGSAPSVRVCMAGVYDESSDTLIFFGGLSCTTTACTPYDETYTIRNVTTAPTWQELYPSGTPPAARAYHSAVYDATNNRMILFGGTTSTANPPAASGRVRDTWVLSNANGTAGTPAWSQLTTAQQPPARSGHSAVFDETNNRMIIFAGAGTDNYVRNDVWILTNAGGTTPAWAEYDTGTPKPASRIHHSAVYTDTAKNRMIIFGGDTGNSTYVNDAWVLRNANGIPTTPVNSITIDSGSTTVCTGYTIQLTAVATDSSGNEISGVLYIWSSSSSAVVTVSSNGLVTGVGAGTATITVSSGNISGQLTMTVIQSTSPPSDGGYTATYVGTRTFCINSVLGNPPSCGTANVVVTVSSDGSVTDGAGLTGTVDSNGNFDGTYSYGGSTWTVTGTFSTTAPFQLKKQPVLPTDESGVNITWDLQKQ